MKMLPRLVRVFLFAGAVLSVARAAGIDGSWAAEFDTQVGPQKYLYQLIADGEKLTGKASWERMGQKGVVDLVEGKIAGDQVSFVENIAVEGMDLRITYAGKLEGDQLQITRTVGDFGTETFVAKRVGSASAVALQAAGPAGATVIPLWNGTAPGSEGKVAPEKVRITAEGEHVVSSIHQPTLTVYLPKKENATGAAVVICPGGGHRELWMDHEGYRVAQWLADHGIAGLILKYRLAREEGSTYRVEVESLADAQRALQLARSHAAEWAIDPARIGIIGFSAGGELAALAAQPSSTGKAAADDPVARQDSAPAFQGLIYPGNAKAILPSKNSPPAFLVCGYNDRPEISEELSRVYLRFKQAGVPAELHIYTGVGHGFGLRATNTNPAGEWPSRFREWLAASGFLKTTM